MELLEPRIIVEKSSKKWLILVIILCIISTIVALVFIGLYINSQRSNPSPDKDSLSSVLHSAGIIENLDRTTKPCDDFYQYSCGGFFSKNYIREDQNKLDAFSLLLEKTQYQMKDLFDKEKLTDYKEVSAMYKTLTYYLSCMNESQINAAGTSHIFDLISSYGSAPIFNNTWTNASWSLEKTLARTLVDSGVGIFLTVNVAPSLLESSKNVINLQNGKTVLGHRLEEKMKTSASDEQAKLIASYKTYMKTVLLLLGVNRTTIDNVTNDIFEFELTFYKQRQSIRQQGALRGYSNIMEYMTLDQLNNLTEGKFNWTLYASEMLTVGNQVLAPDEKILVFLPDNLKLLNQVIQSFPKSTIANTIIWNVINNFIPTLPIVYQETQAKFMDTVNGKKTVFTRWKSCFKLVNTHFPYTNALMYSKKYLSEEARTRAFDLFSEVKNEFIDGLQEQKWMDDETKKAARLKLDMMKNNVGYPSFIKNETALNMFYEEFDIVKDKFFENLLNYIRTLVKQSIRQLHKKPILEPFSGAPVGVNAYYNPIKNAIAVLAGMLQPPYYENNRPNALNYGGIGMVIGHEITHGFDVSGSQFDETGSVRSWWTSNSFKKFVERSTCMAKQYNETYIYGRKVNGVYTLSENIADNGGIKYAFRAYKKWQKNNNDEDQLPGLSFTNDQLFFIGFAQAWCSMYTEAFIDQAMAQDTHALAPVRVSVPLRNFPEFSEAFNCPKQQNTCTVW